MSIYKRGSVYWYKFMWSGQLIRESTKQGNDKTARKMEAAHRTRLAEGLVGIREKKRTTLGDFIKNRFEPWAKGRFENNATKTWKAWYQPSIRTLQNYPTLCNRVLSEITSEHVSDFAAQIRAKGLRGTALLASSVNSRLRVLRRILHLAVEWGELDSAPKFKLEPGERHREHVLPPAEEAKYLAGAPPLISRAAMGGGRKAGRGLGLAGANKERARRAVNREEAAQKCHQSQQGAAVRLV